MLFGTSAFSAAPFSANPDTKLFVGVTGMGMLASLGRVQVSTAFVINSTVTPTGMVLFTNLNGISGWVDVNQFSDNIWTEIVT
jgi:hypothetical protein